MRNDYLHICSCGRIHLIETEKIFKAIDDEKNTLLICGDCGHILNIGGYREKNMYSEAEEMVYVQEISDFSPYTDTIINKEEVGEIIYSHGLKVPMMTGNYANSYFNGRFYDNCNPDFYKIKRNGITVEEIKRYLDDYEKCCQTVDMKRFINENDEGDLKRISNYLIESLCWKNTEYETVWNTF